jgi:hypothetical protein
MAFKQFFYTNPTNRRFLDGEAQLLGRSVSDHIYLWDLSSPIQLIDWKMAHPWQGKEFFRRLDPAQSRRTVNA